MDIARSIQEVTEEVMLKIARFAHRETGQKYLCLAGGVALNCVANGRIVREGPFEEVWVQLPQVMQGGRWGSRLLCGTGILTNPGHRQNERAGGYQLAPGRDTISHPTPTG